MYLPEPVSSNSGHQLAKWAAIVLWGNVAIKCVAFISRALRLNVIGQVRSGLASPEVLVENGTRQGLINGVQWALLAVAAVAFLLWLYRALAVLRRLGTYGTARTPHAAVAQIWRASCPTPPGWELEGLNRKQQPVLISVWWASWIVYAITGLMTAAWARTASSLDGAMLATVLGMLEALVGGAAAWLTIRVVCEIDERQQAKIFCLSARRQQLAPAREAEA